jgi:hypothetical protein
VSVSLLVILALLAVAVGAVVGVTARRSLKEPGGGRKKRPSDRARTGAARIASSLWWWWRKRGKSDEE